MINQKIARIFFEIADILELKEVEWKPRAYRIAAQTIEGLNKDLKAIYKEKGIDGLIAIRGIGKALAKKIIEYIKTGKIREYEKLKKKAPAGISSLRRIRNLGPKKIEFLSRELKIKTIADLKLALKKHKLRNLYGFGEKTEKNLIEELGLSAKGQRYPLKESLKLANSMIRELKKLKEVKRIDVGGSIRRKEATVGDIDILVSTKNKEKIIQRFTTLKEVKKVLAKGPTKSMVVLKNGMQSDIRVVDDKSYGAALQYFTGNKAHNIRLREIAMKKGWKLNEYGLFDKKTGKMFPSNTEEKIYKKLGFKKVPKPEERKE